MIDFKDYIGERTSEFTGREWVYEEIDRWLTVPDAPRFRIITGEPGIGKTAIAARLTQIRKVEAFHFCRPYHEDTINPVEFVRSISDQLTWIDSFAEGILDDRDLNIVGHTNIRRNYGQAIGVKIEKLIIQSESATNAFNRMVSAPLRKLYADGYDHQILILVDALDEAVQHRGRIQQKGHLVGAGFRDAHRRRIDPRLALLH